MASIRTFFLNVHSKACVEDNTGTEKSITSLGIKINNIAPALKEYKKGG